MLRFGIFTNPPPCGGINPERNAHASKVHKSTHLRLRGSGVPSQHLSSRLHRSRARGRGHQRRHHVPSNLEGCTPGPDAARRQGTYGHNLLVGPLASHRATARRARVLPHRLYGSHRGHSTRSATRGLAAAIVPKSGTSFRRPTQRGGRLELFYGEVEVAFVGPTNRVRQNDTQAPKSCSI